MDEGKGGVHQRNATYDHNSEYPRHTPLLQSPLAVSPKRARPQPRQIDYCAISTASAHSPHSSPQDSAKTAPSGPIQGKPHTTPRHWKRGPVLSLLLKPLRSRNMDKRKMSGARRVRAILEQKKRATRERSMLLGHATFIHGSKATRGQGRHKPSNPLLEQHTQAGRGEQHSVITIVLDPLPRSLFSLW